MTRTRAGYLTKDADRAQIVDAVRRLAAGGTVIAAEVQAALAEHLRTSTSRPKTQLTDPRAGGPRLPGRRAVGTADRREARPQPHHGQDPPLEPLREARGLRPRRRRCRGDAARSDPVVLD